MSIIKDKYKEFAQANENIPQKPGLEFSSLDNLTTTYHALWRALGALGIFLPLGLIGLTALKGEKLLPSISDYYYSELNVLFIGSICCIALFLWYYKGTNSFENNLTRIASISALCVAWFPTGVISKNLMDTNYVYNLTDFSNFVPPTPNGEEFENILHYLCAGIFFISLAILVLTFFVKSEKKGDKFLWRIIIYKICGIGILVLISSIIGISIIFDGAENWAFPATFTLESFALAFFGIAWLIKGKTEETRSVQKLKDKITM